MPLPDALTSPGEAAPRVRALVVVDRALANHVAVALAHLNCETRSATTAAACAAIVRDWPPQMILVDVDHHADLIPAVGGGGANGGAPILALTRKRSIAVKLAAFERGADEVVEVPFTLDEIVVRAFALLRRTDAAVRVVPRIRLGGALDVDLFEESVKIGGNRLKLTPVQQTLLYMLAANSGEVLSRESLLSSMWGGDLQIESNVVDRHIRELRVKLEDDWRTPRYIETVAGRGYRFRTKADEAAG